MHLLLTRAIAEAERTRARLEGMGHRVTVAPVTTIVPLASPWPDGAVDSLLASSAHAYSAGALDGARRLDGVRHLPMWLVGERTLAAARRHGFGGEAVVAATAAELLDTIASRRDDVGSLLYLAGRDRKPELEQGLGALGLTCTAVDVYEAAPATALAPDVAAAIRGGAITGVLHFSRRSASLFLQIAGCARLPTRDLRHFCISEDAAGPLRESGHQYVRVAAAPNESALLAEVADQA